MNDESYLHPGGTIGILGGGQLGRMLAIAARQLGYGVAVFAPEADAPAFAVADQRYVAEYLDADALAAFARSVDVATLEFENIPTITLQTVARFRPMHPGAAVLAVAQDRLREKTTVAQLGIATPPFAQVDSLESLRAAVDRLGLPAVLKTATAGYDGKGQRMLRTGDTLVAARSELGSQRAILEGFVDFALEFSVITARSTQGEVATYAPFVNHHDRHILDVTLAPADELTPELQLAAMRAAEAIAAELGVVGLLCVEFFLTREGRILVNELAPRAHNSGHLTLEAHVTSQFEQQVRAITGLPLGSTRQLLPAAMVNLLGDLWMSGSPNFPAALRVSGARLHLYGKTTAKPGRKLGHLTVLSASRQDAETRAREARTLLLQPSVPRSACRDD